MDDFSVKLTLKEDKLPMIMKLFPGKVDEVVRETAFKIEATAKSLAAVDTGAMKASIHTRTSRSDSYVGAAGDAYSRRPRTKIAPVPKLTRRGQAYVGVGVFYGVYVEFGTYRTAAQPFMTPAVEQHREGFKAAFKGIVESL